MLHDDTGVVQMKTPQRDHEFIYSQIDEQFMALNIPRKIFRMFAESEMANDLRPFIEKIFNGNILANGEFIMWISKRKFIQKGTRIPTFLFKL